MLNQLIQEFKVRDFETSYSFYTNYLGFKPLGHVATGERALLVREEVQIYFQFSTDLDTETQEQALQLNPIRTLFRFREIKSIYERLDAADIELFQDPQTVWLKDKDGLPAAGLFEFSVVDPDGHLLVFGQELLPSESLLPFEERMEPIRPMKDLVLRTSALEKTMAFTDTLLQHLPKKMKAWLHPCFITYFDYNQTLQLAFDTSRHMTHMFYLLESRQAFTTIVKRVFGENIRINIISLPRQDESLRELEVLGSVLYLPIAADKSLNLQKQLDTQLYDMGVGHRSEASIR